MKSTRTGLKKPTPRKIQALAKKIGRHFHPDKIILFGSYAYGAPAHDSDVDLLVSYQCTWPAVRAQAVAIRQAVDCPFPVDLLVRTPEQVEERLRLGDSFVERGDEPRKVLYEAGHAC